MLTNQILKSTDRNLLGTIIRQRTNDSFLCLTDLQTSFDKARQEYGWADKRISDVLSNDSMKERIFELLQVMKNGEFTMLNSLLSQTPDNQVVNENEEFTIINTGIPVSINPNEIMLNKFKQHLTNCGIVETYKGLGLWEMKGKGADRVVWVNPYVFMSIALEMNPKIYAQVVVWLVDGLIFNRIEAGDSYKPMNSAIDKILGLNDYAQYAIAINKRVFGKHAIGIRNFATKEELKKIASIEKDVIMLITNKYVKTESELFTAIKNVG